MKYISIIFCFLVSGLFAQNASDVLLTINEKPVYVKEFLQVYNKNLDLVKDESQKNIDTYLKLFIDFKLKIEEAKALGLHEKPTYIKELETYKKELSKNYLTDSKITDALVEEAYSRLQEEVKARHILIRIDANATPKDTLDAYNKLLVLKGRLKNEDFEDIKKELHDGKNLFVEDLGYFSAFKMVYSFENAVYNTPVSEISDPFKTRFGYHIVEVLDKRPAGGKRTVSHIMIKNTNPEAEERIQDIYKKIHQGETFETLAKQFSEDKGSASKGGKLAPFSSGQLGSRKFEDVTFGLQEPEQISEPFETKFGWHIIQLHKIEALGGFEDMKAELSKKIERDSRSKVITTETVNSLIKDYNIDVNSVDLEVFKTFFKTHSKSRDLEKFIDTKKTLLSFEKTTITNQDFIDFLVKTDTKVNLNNNVDSVFKTFLGEEILSYKEAHLEDENEEFAQVINEYRNGLLMFDIMGQKIWNVAKTDTVALQAHYEANKNKYISEERIDGIIATSTSKKILKQVLKRLKKGNTIEDIKSDFNTDNEINVIFTEGIFEKNDSALPKGFNLKTGLSSIYPHFESYAFVDVKFVLPKKQKTFKDVSGLVASEYQDVLEKNWLAGLRKTYKVEVNEKTLEALKTQLKK